MSAPKLSDFDVVRVIGTGTFGKVTVTRHRDSRTVVALKSMKKEDLVRLNQVEHVFNERSVLQNCNHPFIIKLYTAFQDPEYVHLALDYIPGGELFARLRRVGRFSVDVCCFYIAQIVLALQYLHQRRYVYRDLKPENILIDEVGYLRLVDFGFAKPIGDDGKTYTLCGTPEYLAPEVIKCRGYGLAIDWWALGVLSFEMHVGYPPFYDENPFQLYEIILRNKPVYPADLNPIAVDLISRFLVLDPAYRLGNMKAGAEEIKAHPYFSNLNWELLLAKRIPAPYVPAVSHKLDTTHFPSCDPASVGQLPAAFTPPAPAHAPDLQRVFSNF